jgi:hypothetical protein
LAKSGEEHEQRYAKRIIPLVKWVKFS